MKKIPLGNMQPLTASFVITFQTHFSGKDLVLPDGPIKSGSTAEQKINDTIN